MAYAVAEPRLITADELERMPQDGVRRELIRGELREMPPAGGEHGAVALEFARQLANHVRAHGLGRTYAAETGFRLASDPDTVLAPDAAFVRADRLAGARTGGFLRGAPDLVLEVLSPGDSADEMEEKVWEWLGAGCRMVVIVNPRRRGVAVYRPAGKVLHLAGDDVLDGGDVVPGWMLRISELFD